MSPRVDNAERVECDHCGLTVRLRKDGTYGKHGWTDHGVYKQCKKTHAPYSRHRVEFRVIERDADDVAVRWLAACRCSAGFTGLTYEEVSTRWAEHLVEAGPTAGVA